MIICIPLSWRVIHFYVPPYQEQLCILCPKRIDFICYYTISSSISQRFGLRPFSEEELSHFFCYRNLFSPKTVDRAGLSVIISRFLKESLGVLSL